MFSRHSCWVLFCPFQPLKATSTPGNSEEATAGDALVAGALNLVQGVCSLL